MAERTFKGEMYSTGKIEKMDAKDRKIVNELSMNGRFSIATIAKNVGLSRDSVSYRIKSLMDRKIIPGFTLHFDVQRLGFMKHLMYMQFQNLSKSEEDKITDDLTKHKSIVWVATCSGNWDLGLLILSKSIEELSKTTEYVLAVCGPYLKDYIIETEIFDRSLKVKMFADSRENRRKYERDGFQTDLMNPKPRDFPVKLDDKDVMLVNLLMENSRMPIADICHSINLTAPAVENRIRRLIREGAIYGFMPQHSMQLLGYQWHWLFLRVKGLDEKKEKEFYNYMDKHLFTTWYVKTIGKWNFEVSIFAKDALHFKDIVGEIRKEFGDIIRDYDSVMIFNQHKYMHKLNL